MTNEQCTNVAKTAWNLANEPDTDFAASASLMDCSFTIRELQSRIAELVKDAARWKEVAFGSNPFLGVFYVDSFGNERMLCAQDAIDVVDGSINIYMQKD